MNEENFIKEPNNKNNSWNYQENSMENINKNNKNKEILESLIKEIKSENRQIILFNIFIWIIFLGFFVFAILFTLEKFNVFSLKILRHIDSIGQWLFLFTILIPGFLISLILTIYSQLNKYRFDQEKKFHFQYRDEIDLKRVPNFIVEKYKKISGAKILITWFSVMSYIIGALVLAFFIIFRNQSKFTISNIEISLIEGSSFPDYKNEIIITSVYIGVVFVIQITSLILLERRQSQLIAIFDLNNRINWENIRSYQKKVHIICFCVFLLPFFIAILIFWLLKKVIKKSN